MKILLTMIVVCTTIHLNATILGTMVTLPSAEKLKERLCKAQFNDFVEKTGIDRTLGQRTMGAGYIECEVVMAVIKYNARTEVKKIDDDSKMRVLEIILEDVPHLFVACKYYTNHSPFSGQDDEQEFLKSDECQNALKLTESRAHLTDGME